MSDVITLTARLPLKEPADAVVRAALTGLADAVRQEPGCLEYRPHVGAGDPRHVLFYERWASRDALDVHAKAPALTAFHAAMARRVAGPSELNFWESLGD